MKEVIIATQNKGKIKEFVTLFAEFGWTVHSLLDYPSIPDVLEDGLTFQENAVKKAETISRQLNKMVIADDSGLVVDILDGRPGIYSARYAGPRKNDDANNNKLLFELKEVPDKQRSARFVCVLALARPDQETLCYEGICEGMITNEPIGMNGFGYDPIFNIPSLGKTMAQLTMEEKNKWSHRAQALEKLFRAHSDWNQ